MKKLTLGMGNFLIVVLVCGLVVQVGIAIIEKQIANVQSFGGIQMIVMLIVTYIVVKLIKDFIENLGF